MESVYEAARLVWLGMVLWALLSVPIALFLAMAIAASKGPDDDELPPLPMDRDGDPFGDVAPRFPAVGMRSSARAWRRAGDDARVDVSGVPGVRSADGRMAGVIGVDQVSTRSRMRCVKQRVS
jgi:hypothetical protein